MTLVTQDAVGTQERAEVMDDRLIDQLRGIAPVKTDEPLSRHTTFGIGGPAEIFVTVLDINQLFAAASAAREFPTPFFILGSGSNILVGDRGIRGIVIDNQAKAMSDPDEYGPGLGEDVEVASGVSLAALARKMARQGYAGLEWACGIPGTIGGAIVYNAGAYDSCIADVLDEVGYWDIDGVTHVVHAELDPEEFGALQLGYRTSAFLTGRIPGAIIGSAQLRLTKGDPAELTRHIADLDAQRLAAQPRGRNSGSTFKNPAGDHAWRLIDAVGLRGMRIGNARISAKHSNFFENLGGARAADVAALMREAQRRVKEQFGIELQNEVEMVGEGFE